MQPVQRIYDLAQMNNAGRQLHTRFAIHNMPPRFSLKLQPARQSDDLICLIEIRGRENETAFKAKLENLVAEFLVIV